MARVGSSSTVNQTGNGAVCMFDYKACWKLAGWTVSSSGTGTAGSYSSNSDLHTTSTTLGTQLAWFVIRDPGGLREFCLQRSNTAGASGDRLWSIYYSYSAHFTGGSPNANSRPTATDEQLLRSTSNNFFSTSDGSYYHHCVAEDSDENGNGVFGFWFWCTSKSTGASISSLYLEPMKYGTYDVGDIDPCIVEAGDNSSSGFFVATIGSAAGTPGGASVRVPFGWYKKGDGAEAFTFMNGIDGEINTGGSQVIPGTASVGVWTNPFTGNDEGYGILVGRVHSAATERGRKGATRFLAWKSVNRAYPDTGNYASTEPFVFQDDVLVPWVAGSVAPLKDATASTDRTVTFIRYQVGDADATPPVVANPDPADDSTIGAFDALEFDVTDSGTLRRVIVSVKIGSRDHEVAWDGDEFAPRYAPASTRASITNGYHFAITRDGGWPADPVVRIIAIDTGGNEDNP